MKAIYIVCIIILFASCNPCKFVAKHPECFPADTIKITDTIIKHERIVEKQDSIVYDSVPCDPFDPITITKTVFKSKIIYKCDTVIKTKETSKINPLNEAMKAENISYKIKLKNRTGALILLLSLIIGFIIIRKLIK